MAFYLNWMVCSCNGCLVPYSGYFNQCSGWDCPRCVYGHFLSKDGDPYGVFGFQMALFSTLNVISPMLASIFRPVDGMFLAVDWEFSTVCN